MRLKTVAISWFHIVSPHYNIEFREGPVSWKDYIKGKANVPRCGPLSFELHFFTREKIDLEDVSFNRSQVTNFLNANQGIRIYRDGFRVKPYGEPNGEGDWLTFSYKRMQHPSGVAQSEKPGEWRVGYNQVVGAVYISRDKNGALIDQTNREGIVEGPEFSDLRSFAEKAVRFFELKREEFEIARKKKSDYETVRSEAEIKALASIEEAKRIKSEILAVAQKTVETSEQGTIQNLVERIDNWVEKATTAQEAQDRFVEVSQQREAEFQRQKDTLANLASLGILTISFGHETLGSVYVVITNARQLRSSMKQGLFMVLPDVREMVEDNLDFIVSGAEKIETFAGFTLKNVSRDKRKRKQISLSDVIRQVFSAFKKSLDEKNIVVRCVKLKGVAFWSTVWEGDRVGTSSLSASLRGCYSSRRCGIVGRRCTSAVHISTA